MEDSAFYANLAYSLSDPEYGASYQERLQNASGNRNLKSVLYCYHKIKKNIKDKNKINHFTKNENESYN